MKIEPKMHHSRVGSQPNIEAAVMGPTIGPAPAIEENDVPAQPPDESGSNPYRHSAAPRSLIRVAQIILLCHKAAVENIAQHQSNRRCYKNKEKHITNTSSKYINKRTLQLLYCLIR